MKEKLKILYSAGMVGIFTILSTILSFFVQVILAKHFGTSVEMDAYFISITIPFLVIRILSVSLSVSFVPLLKEKEAESEEKAVKFTNNFVTVTFLALLSFSLLAFLFSSIIIRIIAPGVGGETIQLATNLFRISIISTFFGGGYFVLMSIFIAKNKFFLPYFAIALSSLVSLIYVLLFASSQGIYSAVIGSLLGYLTEFLLALFFLPTKYSFVLQLKDPTLREFILLFAPLVAGSFIYKANILFDRFVASLLPPGEISYLGYSFRFLDSSTGILGAGMAVVLLPVTSHLASQKDDSALAGMMSWGLRAVGFVVTPVIVFILLMNQEIISLLLKRGAFTAEDSAIVGSMFALYTGALFALTLGSSVTNIFYAKKEQFTVVKVNMLTTLLYFVLIFFSSKIFEAQGIAASYSIVTILTLSILFIMVRKKVADVNYKRILKAFGRFLIAGIITGVIGIIFKERIANLPLIYRIFVIGAEVAIFYLFVLLILQTPEIKELLGALKKKNVQSK